MNEEQLTEEQTRVDRWSKHMWHTSQHNSIPIFLSGRLQDQANEMRRAVGLEELGWNDAFPDADFKECSVHSEGCEGQETHPDGNPVFVSSIPAQLSHICHAGPPPHSHALGCPTGEHPTGWQHVPGPHKMCDICR